MKLTVITLCTLLCALGCARVQVQAPEKPIKVDISMRLDVYQHVQEDIDAIEDIVSGEADTADDPGEQSFIPFLTELAYAADEELSPEVEQAALRRKARLAEVQGLQKQGALGENRLGLLEARSDAASAPEVQELISAENADRILIYEAISQENDTALVNVQMLYAERLQSKAPSGTPVEDATGWKTK